MANDFRDAQGQIDDTRGVLGGTGWAQQEKVDDEINTDKLGWDFQCKCQTCGRPLNVTIEWGELLVASMKMVPEDPSTRQPWVLHRGFLYPPIVCGCGREVHVPLTPDKAVRCLRAGIAAQYITEQWVQVEQQRVAQAAAAMQRR